MDELRISRFRLRILVAAGIGLAAGEARPVSGATSSGSDSSTSSGSTSSGSSAADDAGGTTEFVADEGSCGTGGCGGGCGCYGRPYVADGRIRQADVARGNGWTRNVAASEPLTHAQREALVAFWTEAALAEHSSVAGFHRFALDLLAHGAPAELVRAAGRAANQEVEHALVCFALASRYAGREIGPGAMPLGSSAPIAKNLVELATWTVREGCVGETVAAWLAAEILAVVHDPEVRLAMATIAAEEAEHAELAWTTVRWAIATGGAPVRDAVARVFASTPRASASPTAVECVAHGLLAHEHVSAVMRRAFEHIVEPCATAMLRACV
ncbi:MAG: hypothetical protein U0168_02375 [Nannocystaceae bacterium]|jgi:hypothetical protein